MLYKTTYYFDKGGSEYNVIYSYSVKIMTIEIGGKHSIFTDCLQNTMQWDFHPQEKYNPNVYSF